MLIVTQVAPYADGPAGVHGVLGQAATGLSELAGLAGLTPVVVSDVGDVSPDALAAARVLALFTIGETPWSKQQKDAAHDSWRDGGLRILGVHSATDANHGWPEYGSMLGARFDGHPWTQDFVIDVVDTDHPATAHLGTRWSVARRGLPLRGPATRRPGPAPPGRRSGRPVGARRTGAGLRLPPRLERGGRCRAHLLQRPGPLPRSVGDPRPTSSTWPGASPGWSRTPNLTSMSGSSSVDSLPEVMAAAVYQSPGVVTVEERTVPRPGPDQLVVRVHACGICGSDIHQLRDGWGFTPGAVAGHEWSGTIAAVGEDVTGWSVGELVVGGRIAALRHLPALPGGQAVAVREPQQHDLGAGGWRLRRVHPVPGRRRPPPPRRPVPAPCRPGRAAVGGAARHHPLGRRARRQRDGLRRRPHRRAERRRAARHGDHGHHGGGAARRTAPTGRRPRRHLPRRPCGPRGVPALGARAHVVTGRRTSSSSARAIGPPSRRGSAS